MIWLRHVLAVTALPFVVTVVIPWWIARRNGISMSFLEGWPLRLVGLGVLAVGLLLFVSSLRRFATEGEGTLAPWDPPRRLVVRGPYRYVRNPMISGIIFVLIGEALVLLSRPHAMWALTFFVINAIYIPLFEEPQLAARFGESYEEYRRHVPRLLPRVRPWNAARPNA